MCFTWDIVKISDVMQCQCQCVFVCCTKSPWGCRVCRCGLWAGLWCTGRHWAAPSLPGRFQTSVTSGPWFSPSWQSSRWPDGKDPHMPQKMPLIKPSLWAERSQICDFHTTLAYMLDIVMDIFSVKVFRLKSCVFPHSSVMYPLTVAVLQASS